MPKSKESNKYPHIQMAIITGISIIVMAYFSKRILPKPIGYIALAIPPFIATIHTVVIERYKSKTWYWVVAILMATALVIAFYWK